MGTNAMMRMELAKTIRSPFCVSNEDGVKVHAILADMIAKKEAIIISFKGVTRLTTAFLNAAVGQLYDEFDETEIDRLLSIVDADRSHIAKFSTTVSNAKKFFKGGSRERVIRDALHDDGE